MEIIVVEMMLEKILKYDVTHKAVADPGGMKQVQMQPPSKNPKKMSF